LDSPLWYLDQGKFNNERGTRRLDGTPLGLQSSKKRIIVATVRGREYYRIVNVLKDVGLKFDSMIPEEVSFSDQNVIITTKNEANIINSENILVFSEANFFPTVFKARIFKTILGSYEDDTLVIGIDPGIRIGIYILYHHAELQRIVQTSPSDAIRFITILLNGIDSKQKIVRIGDGHASIAYCIAREIKNRFKDAVKIELVDEFGTSRKTSSNRRGIRDESSARKIALKSGFLF
jgi:hypothetical protein